MRFIALIISVFLAVLFSCGPKTSNESASFISPDWVEKRVSQSEKRLAETEAGKKVWNAIEAHGGLERWFKSGPLRFHFDYKPLDGSTRRNTYQTVDQWSVRAVHELADDREVKFGWDGDQAWVYPDTAEVPINPRFWSTTPFYFLGLPFVLADEGIIYQSLAPDTLGGTAYDLVKVTYEQGTGDAPEDFYVIYLDQETSRLAALRYIVSYPGFFPDGGHAHEKIMKLNGLREVNGLWLATGYQTYWWKDQPAEHITNIEISEVSFEPGLPDDFFDIPKGARLQQSY